MKHIAYLLSLIAAVFCISWASPALAQGKVDINKADVKGLMSLKGIGEQKAKAIVKYRQMNGPFQKPEDLVNVPGIGIKTVENNKGMIVVGKTEGGSKSGKKPGKGDAAEKAKEDAAKKAKEDAAKKAKEDAAEKAKEDAAEKAKEAQGKVNINKADIEELMSLEGLKKKKAQAIIEYREENGPFESIDDLANVPGIGAKIIDANRDRIALGKKKGADSESEEGQSAE